ncbi:UNVERIFIED_CONTAM: hypothetical protein GTU68_059264 [Idotea baltica]|nr:hypothetical protein [Idotea baltica]
MSGHSKWSTIKRKKGALDAKRGKIFTRCAHEITTAVREGGGPDPSSNSRLRLAMDKAKAVNMPNDNIDRAIKRATGELKGEEQQELLYEGYGPNGTAIMVDVLTDNKNRTVGEIRFVFSRNGGSMGANGCVAWMFDRKGLIVIEKSLIDEETLMDIALEAGADDISGDGDRWEVLSEINDFEQVRKALEEKVELELAELQYLPKTRQAIDPDSAKKTLRLLDALEDLDDVMTVSSNCEFSDADLEDE